MKKWIGLICMLLLLSACGNHVYNEGSYEAEGKGLHGPIRVSVTIDSTGKMTKIDVLKSKENTQLLTKVRDQLIPEMLKNNTYEVDAVSGATEASEGLKEAVKNALEDAK